VRTVLDQVPVFPVDDQKRVSIDFERRITIASVKRLRSGARRGPPRAAGEPLGTDPGHHLALMAGALKASTAVPSPQLRMLDEENRDLGSYFLRKQAARSLPEDFCEWVVEDSYLNQCDMARYPWTWHLRWRRAGVKHSHDMPPSRFAPSPTLGDSSPRPLGRQ
jgi:hypothetical protein